MRLVILTKSTPVLRLRARSRIFLPIRSFFSLTSYSWCRNARSPPAFGHSLVTPLSVTQRLESGLEKRGTADTRSDCGSKRELLITGIHPRCPPVYQETLRVATKYPIILFLPDPEQASHTGQKDEVTTGLSQSFLTPMDVPLAGRINALPTSVSSRSPASGPGSSRFSRLSPKGWERRVN